MATAVVVGWAGVTAAGLGVHELLENPAFEVHRVEVTGNHRVSDVAIRHLADLRDGLHLARLDPERAARRIARHPWIARAEVRRELPGTVRVVVEEHVPRMVLLLDRPWYVDAEGVPFREARTDDLDYPLLTGLDPALVADRPGLARAAILQALDILDLAEARGVFTRDRVSEVHFDPAAGFTLVLRADPVALDGGLRNDVRVVLGFADPADRFERLERLVAAGLDLDRPGDVDLVSDSVAIATPYGSSS